MGYALMVEMNPPPMLRINFRESLWVGLDNAKFEKNINNIPTHKTIQANTCWYLIASFWFLISVFNMSALIGKFGLGALGFQEKDSKNIF
jgi:hypothetical protein